MSFKCPNCNSSRLKKVDDYYECEYCGSRIEKEKDKTLAKVNSPAVETASRDEDLYKTGRMGIIIVSSLVGVLVLSIVLGVFFVVCHASSVPLKVNGFFTGTVSPSFTSTHEFDITGDVKNVSNEDLTDVEIVVTYTIKTGEIHTATQSGITIKAHEIYTFYYSGTTEYFDLVSIKTVKATVDGKTYTLKG